MNIQVDHKDGTGAHHDLNFRISKLALLKHFAFAGFGIAPKLNKLFRILGMLLHYSLYFQNSALDNNHFSLPPDGMYDPTEKGQFSTLAGKAIADYLAKRIYYSYFTINYEAEMKLRHLPVTGSRPDFIAYSPNSIFAIEAKGLTGGHGNMNNHKQQSANGPIPVNFSIASVSFNLFNSVQCNFYDPMQNDIPYNNESLKNTSKEYYSRLSSFINDNIFDIKESRVANEDFYELGIKYRILDDLINSEFRLFPLYFSIEFYRLYSLKILITKRINEFEKSGITREIPPFDYKQDNGIYIDNDRIGLKLNL